MLKTKLLTKALKLAAVSTLCVSLIIPGTVNAAYDVYKPEEKLLIDFENTPAFNLWKSDDDVNFTAEIKSSEKNNSLSVNIPNASQWRTIEFLYNGDIAAEDLPYLVFDMKLPILNWNYVGMKIHANTESGRITNDSLNLEYSKNFSDTGIEVKKVDNAQSAGNWPQDNEWYQWRVNLKELFGGNYSKLKQCYAIQMEIANWGDKAGTEFEFDNFRLACKSNINVYQNFDNITNANDVAWYHNNFDASIDNVGYLGSPALKITGVAANSTRVVFDAGKTIPISEMDYLYMYMDINFDSASTEYIPKFINMEFDLMNGDNRYRLMGTGSIQYADTLQKLLTEPLNVEDKGWNNEGWLLRIPTGKHWFKLDISKANGISDVTEITGLFLQYNQLQESSDGNIEGANFSAVKRTDDENPLSVSATFIIDSISSSVKEITDGDANRDGTVDILDLIRVKKYAAGIQTEICAAADLDGNSEINAADSILLRKKLLEK